MALMADFTSDIAPYLKVPIADVMMILFDHLVGASEQCRSHGKAKCPCLRRSATYADKILKGEKPANIPVEQPTRFELPINMKTAKKLDLEVPLHLQQIATEVVE